MQSTVDSTPTLGCSMLSQLHQILQTNMVQKVRSSIGLDFVALILFLTLFYMPCFLFIG